MKRILLIVIVGIIAYANSLRGVYLLDDEHTILINSHIRHLWPPWEPFRVFSFSEAGGVFARPIYNLSFAINYAIGGLNPVGYHVVNIAIHILSAIFIFLILNLTFREGRLANRFGNVSYFLSLAISILWLLHPLNTAAVTYICQRAESLMSLLMLLTIYCAIRGFKSPKPVGWYAMAIGSCILGMGVKEVAFVTPILVLFYDRTFVSGSFRAALQKRKILYLVFIIPMILAVAEVILVEGTKAFTTSLVNISPVEYLMTQTNVLLHYIKLSIFPHPLIFYYWCPVVKSLSGAILPGLLILILLLATAIAFWRLPSVGFLGAWFFVILAPTSSIVPIPMEIAAEHRMYLPLAAIITLFVLIPLRITNWRITDGFKTFITGVAIILCLLTYLRNKDYYSVEGMWRDVIAKRPDNPLAYEHLGETLLYQHKYEEAMSPLTTAIALLPTDPAPESNLGVALKNLGHTQEAILHYKRAIELDPNELTAIHNLGNTYAFIGKHELAIHYLERAYQMAPEKIEWLQDLNQSLATVGKVDDAIEYCRQAIKNFPANQELYIMVGDLYITQKKPDLAIGSYLEVLKKLGNDAISEGRLARIYATYPDPKVRNTDKGIKLAEHACRLTNNASPELLDILGAAYAAGGRFEDAVKVARGAAELAERTGKPHLSERIKLRISRYQSKKALEEIPY